MGNTSLTAVRLLRAAQREGQRLSRRHNWTALIRTHTITTTTTDTFAIPSDLRFFIDDTAWDRTNYRKMRGSLTPREWEIEKSALQANVRLNKRFRLAWDSTTSARAIVFHNTLTAGETLVIEYVSNSWCESSTGTAQTSWAADTDVARLDEDLIEMGVMWRFLRSLGLSYLDEKDEYEDAVKLAIAQDQPLETIRMAGVGDEGDPALSLNIGDTGYGL